MRRVPDADVLLRRSCATGRASTARCSAPSKSSARPASRPAALPAGGLRRPAKARGSSKGILGRYDTDLAEGRFVDSRGRAAPRARGRRSREPPATRRLYLLPTTPDLTPVERGSSRRSPARGARVLTAPPPAGSKSRRRRASSARPARRTRFARSSAASSRRGSRSTTVEILHTDPSTYPALVWELAREHGVALHVLGRASPRRSRVRARPRSRSSTGSPTGFEADRLREALASGALTFDARRPDGRGRAAGHAAAVARALRDAQIGWGARVTAPRSTAWIAELERPERARGREADDAGERSCAERGGAARAGGSPRPRRAAASPTARSNTRAPPTPESGRPRARSPADAREFVVRVRARRGRSRRRRADRAREAPRGARGSAAATLSPSTRPSTASATRSAQLSIDADRPRPGRVHVADYRAGGFSGRRTRFSCGLDEARHPGGDLEDPVLLDDERRSINRLARAGPLPAVSAKRPRERRPARSSAASRVCPGA